jgi:hypothetical protein
MIAALPNEDIWNTSTNSALTTFFPPNIFNAPYAVKEIKFCRRYSYVNPYLCKQLNIESKILEVHGLFIPPSCKRMELKTIFCSVDHVPSQASHH